MSTLPSREYLQEALKLLGGCKRQAKVWWFWLVTKGWWRDYAPEFSPEQDWWPATLHCCVDFSFEPRTCGQFGTFLHKGTMRKRRLAEVSDTTSQPPTCTGHLGHIWDTTRGKTAIDRGQMGDDRNGKSQTERRVPNPAQGFWRLPPLVAFLLLPL